MSDEKIQLFQEVIDYFGNQPKTAKALGIKQSSVRMWLFNGRMSADNALLVQKLTNGKFKALDLRPSLKEHLSAIEVA